MTTFFLVVALIFFVGGAILVLVALYKLHTQVLLYPSVEQVNNPDEVFGSAANSIWLLVGGFIFIVTAVFIYRTVGGV